tara:strand:+ start:33 stop:239 length:207 start_codon:yes stop_codon:yes gene_type:complete
MEFTIKITNEELLKLILLQKKDDETNEKVIEEPIKRSRGRPRIHEPKDPNAPKRKVGRPKKFKMNLGI